MTTDTKPADNASRNRRILALVAVAFALAAFVFLAMGGIGENLVYYWSPSELKEAGTRAQGASVRLGGLVAPGTIRRGDDGLALSFAVTDGKEIVPVVASTVPPAMFREGIGVVVEGSLAADGNFHTERLMVKHDNEYRAPSEEDQRSIEELVKSLQVESDRG